MGRVSVANLFECEGSLNGSISTFVDEESDSHAPRSRGPSREPRPAASTTKSKARVVRPSS